MVTYQKIEGRPGFYEAAELTVERNEKTGKYINSEYKPLGKFYRLLREGEEAPPFQESIKILDPDDFEFKTLIRVETWCICEHSTQKPDAEPGLCYCAACGQKFTWIPIEGLTPAQEEKMAKDSPGTVMVPLDKIDY